MMEAAHRSRADWAEQHLARIEELGVGSEYEGLYLWPRTPLTPDHQEIIARRVGVDDYHVDDPRSRSGLIIGKLRESVRDRRSPLEESFRLLDVPCGDAVVLWQIKKAFPKARCFGVDCNKGVFATNADAMAAGVSIFKGYLQHLFAETPPEKFDVTLMLNTYRDWENAELHESEKNLPEQVDRWFAQNSHYVVVTATEPTIERLREQGWFVETLGKGEDASTMIWMTRDHPPQWQTRAKQRLRRLVQR